MVLTISLIVILICSYLIFMIKISTVKREKKSLLKEPQALKIENDQNKIQSIVDKEKNVEILNLEDKAKGSIVVKDDTLDLDDLFKTISISSFEDDDFAFDLQRTEKK